QAENGTRGLAVAQHLGEALDLILTDVIMPEMGGPEMIAAVYEVGLEPAVVYCSGYTDGLLPPSVLADDAVYLEKPFQAAVLAERVQTALTASALRRAPEHAGSRTPGD
ncbi:MAG: response regulator, partial [Gemmatimonadaceae bacterium]